jgi:pimeloyl-ACP methyl ester carboxylesterase
MGDYAQVGDVKTWYEVSGDGEPLVLLHGGMSMMLMRRPEHP